MLEIPDAGLPTCLAEACPDGGLVAEVVYPVAVSLCLEGILPFNLTLPGLDLPSLDLPDVEFPALPLPSGPGLGLPGLPSGPGLGLPGLPGGPGFGLPGLGGLFPPQSGPGGGTTGHGGPGPNDGRDTGRQGPENGAETHSESDPWPPAIEGGVHQGFEGPFASPLAWPDGAGAPCPAEVACDPAEAEGRMSLAADADHDGIRDEADNCPTTPNPDQADLDRDRRGDACDEDADGDGVAEWLAPGFPLDNCPRRYNPEQVDANGDGVGDACQAVLADRTESAGPDAPQPRRAAHDGVPATLWSQVAHAFRTAGGISPFLFVLFNMPWRAREGPAEKRAA